MEIPFLILLFVLGACFGSFLCCQARRLHLREAHQPPQHQSPKSHSHTHKPHQLNSRSICLHCQRQLKWYDNIPIFSWLILRGKCHYCHKSIGLAEILSELSLGFAFLALGTTFDPASSDAAIYLIFILTLVFVLIIAFLAIYDGLYGELPTTVIWASIICAFVILVSNLCIALSTEPFTIGFIWRPLASVLILGGLYLVLYLISRGRWVGDGDWMLGTAIAIVLADPWLALITLFLTNVIACLVMLPAMKGNPQRKIHLGPFMVAAFVIVLVLSNTINLNIF